MGNLGDILKVLRAGHIVDSRLYFVRVQLATILAASAYTANDALGGVFKVRVPKSGIIHDLKLVDPDDDTLALTCHLFDRQITGVADNAAFSITAGDSVGWVTSVLFDALGPLDIGGAKVSNETGWNSHYHSASGYLWGQCSTTGTPTIAAGAMPWLSIGILPAVPLALE